MKRLPPSHSDRAALPMAVSGASGASPFLFGPLNASFNRTSGYSHAF